MTPRELVAAAIEFQRPDRLPVNGFGEQSDVVKVARGQLLPPEAEGINESLPTGQRVDEWLCVWDCTEVHNMGQVKGHPLEDLDRIDEFPWPDGADPARYADVPARLAEINADPATRDKYRRSNICLLLWEKMHSLHGFENCMIDLMDDARAIHDLADRILAYNLDVVRTTAKVCGDEIDGFGFTEDWGTQLDTHISPDLFRQFFQPRYKQLFDAIHDAGWHVWMHSCGKINKFLQPLIEVGLDVVNMQQPLANGIDEVGREFAGRITFETLCDIQMTLPRGDRAEITDQARRLMTAWGTPDGGFVLGDYGDAEAIGTARETKGFMLQEFRRLDPWAHGWPASAHA